MLEEGLVAGQAQPAAGAATASEVLIVLVAEDEAPIAEIVAAVVEEVAGQPVLAAHGREALHLARQRRPVLVITDLMMPHLNGAELIAALRADAAAGGYPTPPIILMTAAGPGPAAEAGADAILRKPFNLDDLEALLRRFLVPT